MNLYLLIFILFLMLSSCTTDKDNRSSVARDSSATIATSSAPNPHWIGRWERNQNFSAATMEIKSINNDSMLFSIMAYSGANTGEIEGVSKVKGNKAVFVNKEHGDNCRIEFELKGDSIIVLDQTEGVCMAGMGVIYSGEYKNARLIKPSEEQETSLKDLGIFQTEEEEKAFKELVGKDYKLFINSSQLITEDKDVDSLNCVVYESGVRGVYTYMENIIMINRDGSIWAAVIEEDKVNYYTNRKNYVSKLPQTIENWRERFSEKEVVYKSQ